MLPTDLTEEDVKAFFSLPDDDDRMHMRSWFCDPCKVEVYERRCPHCGKLERDKT